MRLALQLFALWRQVQAAPLAQEQRIAQPILEKINQIAQRRAVFAQLERGFRQAAVLGHGGEGFQLGKGINQARHAVLPSIFRGIFPHQAFFIIGRVFLS